MSFSTGSGSSSIAGSVDVILNSPANNEVLGYNSSLAKWQNQISPSAPVTSVAGKTGIVTLAEADITNLTTDLSAKLSSASNLSDLASPSVALSNIGAAPSLTTSAVKTSAYLATANLLIPADATTAPFTVTLPTAPADKTRIVVKKIDNSANAVTVATGGSDVFNKTGGATTASLSLQNQAMSLQYTTSTGIWYVIGDGLPLSQLDAHYNATYVVAVGTSASPISNAATVRPVGAVAVYWICANGVTPTNALTGDIIFNAS